MNEEYTVFYIDDDGRRRTVAWYHKQYEAASVALVYGLGWVRTQ